MKKRISLAAVFAVLLSIAVFAVPSFETVENGSETTQSADKAQNTAATAAAPGEIPPPGINILTGTTEAKTFEAYAENTDYLTNSGYAHGFNNTGIASATIVKKNNSNALYICSASGAYPFFRWKMPTTIEAGRPVYVSVSAQTTSNKNFWFIGMQRTDTSNASENIVYNPNKIAWLGKNPTTVNIGADTKSYVKKVFSLYSSQAISQLGFQAEKSGGMYLDALAFIPYYKISYCAPDGSVLDAEYVLLDENGAFLTAYTPSASVNPYGDALKGWATAPDGAVTNSVTLNHADISLYAVIDTTGLAEIKYDANKPTLADAVTGLPASAYATPNASFTLSAAKLSASYFVFKGWSLEKKAVADYAEADLVSAVTPNGTDALTVYAVWDYDYSAPSMKSVEFGGDDEDAILDALYTDRTLTYSKFSLADGLGVYTPNTKMSNYDRYCINIGA